MRLVRLVRRVCTAWPAVGSQAWRRPANPSHFGNHEAAREVCVVFFFFPQSLVARANNRRKKDHLSYRTLAAGALVLGAGLGEG